MPQRNTTVELILTLALLLPAAASADVFKCVGEDGQITFSQTPCPPKISAADPPPPQTIAAEADAPVESTVVAATHQRPLRKELAPAVAAARARAAEAHDEQKRQQCETNLNAQIDSIDSQMRGDSSTARGEALRKKRSALKARLDDC